MLRRLFINKIFIRGFYICGLLIWVLTLFKEATTYPFSESTFEIPYAYLFWPPTITLVLHLIFNKKTTWGLVFICYNLLFLLYIKEYIIDDFNSYHGGEKYYMNTATSFIISGVVTGIIILIDWTIYKTRPIDTDKKHSI